MIINITIIRVPFAPLRETPHPYSPTPNPCFLYFYASYDHATLICSDHL